MAYPILAAQNTWWKPVNTSVKRSGITEIEVMDSYTPDSSVTIKDSWDASSAQDGSVMCYVIGSKLIIAGNGSGKVAMNNDSAMAFGYFYNDGVSCFSNVTRFDGCNVLDVSNCSKLSFVFSYMSKVTSLDVGSWDTSKATTLNSCFWACKALTSIDVENWDVRGVEDFGAMFQQCENLTNINVSKWNTLKAKYFSAMFNYCEKIKTLNVNSFNTRNVINMNTMFGHLPIESIDISHFNTSACTNMSFMFIGCSNLKTLNLSNFDTSSCINMGAMFEDCSGLISLDISNWNTSSCTDISFMFYGCSSLGEIDVSNWDVSKVTNFDHFAAHANLKRKGIENWKTTSATNMNAMFHNCAEEELDLSGFDTSKVQFFCQMFENSPNLKRVKGLDKWNTSAGLGFDGMFERCSKLEEVDLSAFNTTKAKNNVNASSNNHKTATLNNMFLSCNNLKKVKLGPNFAINGDGSNTTAANKLILPTPSTDYITGADGNWYAFNGDPYAPNAIPDRTADIYFASFPLCQDQDVIVKNGSMIDTAKAIREKNGATTKYNPSQFGTAIRALN